MPNRIKLIIKGRVQGVFFRRFAKQTADSIGIKGYVRNLPDGSVEVVAECSEPKLKEFLVFCRKGPKGANVTNIQVLEHPSKNEFIDFSISC